MIGGCIEIAIALLHVMNLALGSTGLCNGNTMQNTLTQIAIYSSLYCCTSYKNNGAL